MRIARFSHNGEVSYGVVLGPERPAGEAGGAADDTGMATGTGSANGSAANGSDRADQLMVAQLAGHPFGGRAEDIKLTGIPLPLARVPPLAPILPRKVVGTRPHHAAP